MRHGTKETPPQAEATIPISRQRLDLWLWHARFLARRKDCAALVQSGHVRVNAMRLVQPGHVVKRGDVLTLALPTRTLLIKVIGFLERRGGPNAALALYEPVEPTP